MTIQQWLFSFKGRIGRRDFWIWIGLWFAGMLVLFSLAGKIYSIFRPGVLPCVLALANSGSNR
ncbi:hypothetical protein F9X20_026175 [Escherichia coli]|nr:hypothetical protein [Escherichia coli]